MDWRRLAKALVLQDGRINEREAEVLRREMLADGVVRKPEAEFLLELRRSAVAVHPEFDRFFLDVLKQAVLSDGVVNDAEARWLRETLFTGASSGSGLEAKFLADLQQEARATGAEFRALCRDFLPAGGGGKG